MLDCNAAADNFQETINRRSSGILLHPTSLPGRFGIGDLGQQAYRFVDSLARCGQRYWQVLPLGPTGYGDSPYQSYSSLAGNPLLVSLEMLAGEGWLKQSDLAGAPQFCDECVEYDRVRAFKLPLLRQAAAQFLHSASVESRREFELFCGQSRSWLESFARFMVLRDVNENRGWNQWTRSEADALETDVQKFIQFIFFRQWRALKYYCHRHEIRLIGDIPIFVAHDSADVWSHPEIFHLDESGAPTFVAGVPPDYFSATGQRWGNPLYRWDVLASRGYSWWIERVRGALELVDQLRLDHFRGFEKYYEIPASEPAAMRGRWVAGPGARFLSALRDALGGLPLIAEDLGLITPEVEALRDEFHLPGMRVLQFAFGGKADNAFLPHNYSRRCVAYTGTHDNDTTVGWFSGSGHGQTLDRNQVVRQRRHALNYLRSSGREIHWDFIRAVLASVADVAIIPLQDVLGLGSEARMNLPGSTTGNWRWRFCPEQWTPDLQQRLAEMTRLYGR